MLLLLRNLQPSQLAELPRPRTAWPVRGSASPTRTGRPSEHAPERSTATPSRWPRPDTRRQLLCAADLATTPAPWPRRP